MKEKELLPSREQSDENTMNNPHKKSLLNIKQFQLTHLMEGSSRGKTPKQTIHHRSAKKPVTKPGSPFK